MFKKSLVLGLVGFLSVSAVAVKAHAEDKIGLVSLQRALNEVEEGKRIKAKLKADYEGKKKQIDALKGDLDKLSQDLEKQKMVLSQEALKVKTQELQSKFIDLQNKAATYEKDLKTQEAENAKRMILSLRNIVNDIAKQGGYSLVIENSAETVLFSSNATDLTPNVIAAYNSGKK